ncbi:hypothetical protein G6F57_018439 [Rhizopus arrhizus]|nr:hypothetical protein G6F57_018439 [Rhizopus arrhizus]
MQLRPDDTGGAAILNTPSGAFGIVIAAGSTGAARMVSNAAPLTQNVVSFDADRVARTSTETRPSSPAMLPRLHVEPGAQGHVTGAGCRRGPDHPARIERNRVAVCNSRVVGQGGRVCTFRLAMDHKGAGRADERAKGRDRRACLDSAGDVLHSIRLPATHCSRSSSVNIGPGKSDKHIPQVRQPNLGSEATSRGCAVLSTV